MILVVRSVADEGDRSAGGLTGFIANFIMSLEVYLTLYGYKFIGKEKELWFWGHEIAIKQ